MFLAAKPGHADRRIWRFDPGTGTSWPAGRLPGADLRRVPPPWLGSAVPDRRHRLRRKAAEQRSHAAVAAKAVHRARPRPGSPTRQPPHPFSGQLMIADRGNNRLLVVNAQKHILWQFPSRAHPAPPGGFYFPDDAFFIHGGTGIISNEEQNERIVQLSFPAGKLLWSYGHPGLTGSEPGYLHEPDDAYLLSNGTVSVADAQNCRVLLISHAKKILEDFGNPASCSHEPPRPLGSPNGDTPLADGNLLDLGGERLLHRRDHPGRASSSGPYSCRSNIPPTPSSSAPTATWSPTTRAPAGSMNSTAPERSSGPTTPPPGTRMLNHPSLAERLPNGLIAANDDYRDRVVIIDPRTKKIVWQYGVTGEPGTGPDHLHIPDGFDLLAPNGTTPTHPFTG